MRIHYKFFIAAALIAGSFSAGAQPVETFDFSYTASELTTEEGAKSLHERIQKVAETICDEDFPWGSVLRSRAKLERCETQVTEELVGKINHPLLYKVYARATIKS